MDAMAKDGLQYIRGGKMRCSYGKCGKTVAKNRKMCKRHLAMNRERVAAYNIKKKKISLWRKILNLIQFKKKRLTQAEIGAFTSGSDY